MSRQIVHRLYSGAQGNCPRRFARKLLLSGQLRKASKKPLPAQIRSALTQLAPHRRLLKRLASTGGKTNFCVGWFCAGQTGDSLADTLLRELADLRIGIELFVYPPDKPVARRPQRSRKKTT